MDENQKLDLDALVPKGAVVTLGGVEYDVPAPSLRTLPELSRKLSKLSSIDQAETDIDEIASALEELNATIRLVIPTLPDDVELSIEQCTAIIELVMKMVTPPEQQALANQGLTPSSKKKIGSAS